MLQELIDRIFGGEATKGIKSEITAFVLASLNLGNYILSATLGIELGEEVLSTANTVIVSLLAVFLGARITRDKSKASSSSSSDSVPKV